MKRNDLPVFKRYAAITGYRSPDRVKRSMRRRLEYALAHPPPTEDQIADAMVRYAVISEEIHRVDMVDRNCDYAYLLRDQARSLQAVFTAKKNTFNWVPRCQRWSQAIRDERRATHDKKFAKKFTRLNAARTRLQSIVVQIATVYDFRILRIRGKSNRGRVVYGKGDKGYTEWKGTIPVRYQAANAGAVIVGKEIVLTPVRGRIIKLPMPPKLLLRRAVVGEAFAIGILGCKTKYDGVIACYMPMMVKSCGGRLVWKQVGWSIRGVAVPERVATGQYAPEDILKEANQEVRRIMLERVDGGLETLLKANLLQRTHSDAFGELYHEINALSDLRRRSRDSMAIVRVVNSTSEPDGSFKNYLLRVPGNMMTAREAVAWTFDLRSETYQPMLQS